MAAPGQLDKRFYWERVGPNAWIYDREVGTIGNVASAVDGPTAERLCRLLNREKTFRDLTENFVIHLGMGWEVDAIIDEATPALEAAK